MGFLTRKRRPTEPSSPPVDHMGYHMGVASTPCALHEPYHLYPPHGYPPQPPLIPCSTSHFQQPVGYLPPPQVVNGPPLAGTSLSLHHGDQGSYPPIIVNQHYYLGTPPANAPSDDPSPSSNAGTQIFDDQLPSWHSYGTQLLNQGAAGCDQIWSKFNNVMTLIDGNMVNGDEEDLFMYESSLLPSDRPAQSSRGLGGPPRKGVKDTPKGHSAAVASSLVSKGYFSKVELYANSKLPLNLPPLKL